MMYIFCNRPSESAHRLVEALAGHRLRNREEARNITDAEHNRIVCWGESIGGLSVPALNDVPVRTKYEDAVLLAQAGLPTIEVSRHNPTTDTFSQAQEYLEGLLDGPRMFGSPVWRDAAIAARDALNDVIATTTKTWLPRVDHHQGGHDLIHPPTNPDFWVAKLDITREWRVHSFLGRSIRAGRKIPSPNAHPWIRGWDQGWTILYGHDSIQPEHRALAHKAVNALNLHFGAVDLGETQDGKYLVLEVNRAPGLEGGTIESYARAIQKWRDA